MKPPKGQELNMGAWGRVIAESVSRHDPSLKQIGEEFRAPRREGWRRVAELNLPRNSLQTVSLEEFLQKKDELVPDAAPHKWFILLESRREEGRRFRKPFGSAAEVKQFVDATIRQEGLKLEDVDVSIQDSFEQKYGGNILIDRDGGICVEFIRGNQGVMAEGRYHPDQHGKLFQVTRDPYLQSIKYSWEDGEATDGVALRPLIYRALTSIPHTGEGREIRFEPGYYEFALVDKEQGAGLEPIFLDARAGEVFTQPLQADVSEDHAG